MKILYTKGRMLFTLSLILALAGVRDVFACTSPTLSVISNDITCHGAHNGSISVTATGGVAPYTYSWTSSTGFTSTATTITGLDSGSYTVVVTESGGGCTTTQTININTPQPLEVVTSSNAPFCPGGTLALYSTTTGGTEPYMFSWTGPNSFTAAVDNPTIANATAANNGVYSVTVTDAHNCTTGSTFSVLLYPEPIVNLGPDTGYICGGTPVPLDAGNLGSTYLWNTGAVTETIVATVVGPYSVAVTNMYMCVGYDSIYIASSPYVAPSVTIDTFTNNICQGTPVTFHATPVHGGDAPVYLWRKNGVIISGATNDTYTDPSLNNNDYITTRLTSSFACASPTTAYSDTARVTVVANDTVSVSLTHLPDTACSGTPITFTASAVNGGLSPYYEWIRGGSVVGTGNTYVYSPTTVETVTVHLVSSIVCHVPDTVSASGSFVLYPHLVPHAHTTFTPNDTVAFLGQVITFFCEETYGGASPTYQWYVDKVAVPGATNSSYARHVYNNDTVKCIVNSSDVCAIPRRDTSNTVIIYASFLGINGVNASHTEISIFPNPSDGNFTLNGTVGVLNDEQVLIEVRDLKGSLVHRQTAMARNGELNEQLSISAQLPEGMYLVKVQSDADEQLLKLVIKK